MTDLDERWQWSRVTRRDLQMCSRDIVTRLRTGHAFVLMEDGHPLAHLTPIQNAVTPAQGRSSGLQLERLRSVLAEHDLACILGVSVRALSAVEDFPPVVTGRMTSLDTLIEDLSLWNSPSQLSTWLRRPRQELQRRSPLDRLAFPWTAGDSRSEVVLDLARHDRRRHMTRRLDAPE